MTRKMYPFDDNYTIQQYFRYLIRPINPRFLPHNVYYVVFYILHNVYYVVFFMLKYGKRQMWECPTSAFGLFIAIMIC